MHDIADTEDSDSAAERFWPEHFKYFIRAHIGSAFGAKIKESLFFKNLYEETYSDKNTSHGFGDYGQFVKRLEDIINIGAENGADNMFDRIYKAFKENRCLPNSRPYARNYQPEPVDEALKKALQEEVFEEYRNLHDYEHIYEGYHQWEGDFESFVLQIADLVTVGIIKGADDAIGMVYRAFLTGSPLPFPRRRPRRLKDET